MVIEAELERNLRAYCKFLLSLPQEKAGDQPTSTKVHR